MVMAGWSGLALYGFCCLVVNRVMGWMFGRDISHIYQRTCEDSLLRKKGN